ncbi:TPA: four-carbon acid sugar kinase family protein [Klebsiella quasipneumoniae subsp. quasipneumoniae]|nr:four-carbon acid sugar kinase family protein [Klebsiella quasipneumoniae subsp. quasipneumoniae]HCM7839959.1 four-carbon acid sugar kinase family protein [Klebsiella quasipneumoniae subsp. quasipneumoniae]HCM8038694.1 four-carbon acid sugar kinase family protein [Klebsiella quasipneumoniae subsp. quasipneumoniae]
MIKLDVIADDFTGATDIASFMVNAGWKVVLFNGVPTSAFDAQDTDAIVIALKSRSIPVNEAVEQSLSASAWLKAQGCQRQLFKYCSTFDSTAQGNIGPVTDALMKFLNTPATLLCPAVPDNGRTIVHGHLFVKGELLNESGMEHHPVTPMKHSSLKKLMEAQSMGLCGMINLDKVKNHPHDIASEMEKQLANKARYFIFDVLDNQDLLTVARATANFPLVTGAAGLGYAIATLDEQNTLSGKQAMHIDASGSSVVLSGSCSAMTNQQVDFYQQRASSLALDVEKIIHDPTYLEFVAQWAIAHASEPMAPMVYATQPPQIIELIQKNYGAEYVSDRIETFFSSLAQALTRVGFNKFIVAGGETSGAVTQGLNIEGMIIGESVAPGVPWTQVLNKQQWVILKSGNFGSQDFFQKAQEHYHE